MKNSKNGFNSSLHGARGVAALMVFMSHIGISGITDKFFTEIPKGLLILKYLLLSGQYGVEIFFMISGYLITNSIIKHQSVRSFLKDRCIRLYPAFLPVILLIFILGPMAGYAYFVNVSGWEWGLLLIANLLFIPGVYPIEAALVVAWSLSYEAVFYLSLSFLKYFAAQRVICGMFFALVALPFMFFYPRALFFVVGVVIYFSINRNALLSFRLPKLFIFNFSCFLAVLCLIQFHESFYIDLSLLAIICLKICALILGYLVFFEIAIESRVASWLLKWRWIQFMGTISYSFYIWHTPIMFGTKRFFAAKAGVLGGSNAFLLFFCASLFIALIVSYISYVLFEVKVVKYLSGRTIESKKLLDKQSCVEG